MKVVITGSVTIRPEDLSNLQALLEADDHASLRDRIIWQAFQLHRQGRSPIGLRLGSDRFLELRRDTSAAAWDLRDAGKSTFMGLDVTIDSENPADFEVLADPAAGLA